MNKKKSKRKSRSRNTSISENDRKTHRSQSNSRCVSKCTSKRSCKSPSRRVSKSPSRKSCKRSSRRNCRSPPNRKSKSRSISKSVHERKLEWVSRKISKNISHDSLIDPEQNEENASPTSLAAGDVPQTESSTTSVPEPVLNKSLLYKDSIEIRNESLRKKSQCQASESSQLSKQQESNLETIKGKTFQEEETEANTLSSASQNDCVSDAFVINIKDSTASSINTSSDINTSRSKAQCLGVSETSLLTPQACPSDISTPPNKSYYSLRPSIVIPASDEPQIIEILPSKPCACPEEKTTIQPQANSQSLLQSCAPTTSEPQTSNHTPTNSQPQVRFSTKTMYLVPSHNSEENGQHGQNLNNTSMFVRYYQPPNHQVPINPGQSVPVLSSVYQNSNTQPPVASRQNFQPSVSMFKSASAQIPIVPGQSFPSLTKCQEHALRMQNPQLRGGKVHTTITVMEEPSNDKNLNQSSKHPTSENKSKEESVDTLTDMDHKQRKSKRESKRSNEKYYKKSKKTHDKKSHHHKKEKRRVTYSKTESETAISDMFSQTTTDTPTTVPTSAPSSTLPSTAASSSAAYSAPRVRIKPIQQYAWWKPPPMTIHPPWPMPVYYSPPETHPPMPWPQIIQPQLHGTRPYPQVHPQRPSDWNSPQMQAPKEPIFNPPEVIWMLSPQPTEDAWNLFQRRNPMTPQIYVYPSRRSQSYPQAAGGYQQPQECGSVSTSQVNGYPPESNMQENYQANIYRACSWPQMTTSPEKTQRTRECKPKVTFAPFISQANPVYKISSWPCVSGMDDYDIYASQFSHTLQEIHNEPFQSNISRNVECLSQGNDLYEQNEREISETHIDPEYDIEYCEKRSSAVNDETAYRNRGESLSNEYSNEYDNESRTKEYIEWYDNKRVAQNDPRSNIWEIPNGVYSMSSQATNLRSQAQDFPQTKVTANSVFMASNDPYILPERRTNNSFDMRKPSIQPSPMEYPDPRGSTQWQFTNPYYDRGIYQRTGGVRQNQSTQPYVHKAANRPLDVSSRQTPILPRFMMSKGPQKMSGRTPMEENYLPQNFKRPPTLPWTINRNPQVMMVLGIPKVQYVAGQPKSVQEHILNRNARLDCPEPRALSATSNHDKAATPQKRNFRIPLRPQVNKCFTSSSNSDDPQTLEGIKDCLLELGTDAVCGIANKLSQNISCEPHDQYSDTKRETDVYYASEFFQPLCNSWNNNPTMVYQLSGKRAVPSSGSNPMRSENLPAAHPRRRRPKKNKPLTSFYNSRLYKPKPTHTPQNSLASIAHGNVSKTDVSSAVTQSKSVSTMIEKNSLGPRCVDAFTMADFSKDSFRKSDKMLRRKSRTSLNLRSSVKGNSKRPKGMHSNNSETSTLSQNESCCTNCPVSTSSRHTFKKQPSHFGSSVKKRKTSSNEDNECANIKYCATAQLQDSFYASQMQFNDSTQFSPSQTSSMKEPLAPNAQYRLFGNSRRNVCSDDAPRPDLTSQHMNNNQYYNALWPNNPYISPVPRVEPPGASYPIISKEFPPNSQEFYSSFPRQSVRVPNAVNNSFTSSYIPNKNKAVHFSNAAYGGVRREHFAVPNVSHPQAKYRHSDHGSVGTYSIGNVEPGPGGCPYVPDLSQRSALNGGLAIFRDSVGSLNTNVPRILNGSYPKNPYCSLQSTRIPHVSVGTDSHQIPIPRTTRETYLPSMYNSFTKEYPIISEGQHLFMDTSSHIPDEIETPTAKVLPQFSNILHTPARETHVEKTTNHEALSGATKIPYGFYAIHIPRVANQLHCISTAVPVTNENVVERTSRVASEPRINIGSTMNGGPSKIRQFAQYTPPTNIYQYPPGTSNAPYASHGNMRSVPRNVYLVDTFADDSVPASHNTHVPLRSGQYRSASRISELLFADSRSRAKVPDELVEESNIRYNEMMWLNAENAARGLERDHPKPTIRFHQCKNAASITQDNICISSLVNDHTSSQNGKQFRDAFNESSLRKEQNQFECKQNALNSLLQPVTYNQDITQYRDSTFEKSPYDVSPELFWDQFTSRTKLPPKYPKRTKSLEEKESQTPVELSIYSGEKCRLNELRHTQVRPLSSETWAYNRLQSASNHQNYPQSITKEQPVTSIYNSLIPHKWSTHEGSAGNPGLEADVKWQTVREAALGVLLGIPANQMPFTYPLTNNIQNSISEVVSGDSTQYTTNLRMMSLEKSEQNYPSPPKCPKITENVGNRENNSMPVVSPVISLTAPSVICSSNPSTKSRGAEISHTNGDSASLTVEQFLTPRYTSDQNQGDNSHLTQVEPTRHIPCPWSLSDLPDIPSVPLDDGIPKFQSCVFASSSQNLPQTASISSIMKYLTMLPIQPLEAEQFSNAPHPTSHVEQEFPRPTIRQRVMRDNSHRSATEIPQGSIPEDNTQFWLPSDRFSRGSVRSRSLSRSRAGGRKSPPPRKVCSDNTLR